MPESIRIDAIEAQFDSIWINLGKVLPRGLRPDHRRRADPHARPPAAAGAFRGRHQRHRGHRGGSEHPKVAQMGGFPMFPLFCPGIIYCLR